MLMIVIRHLVQEEEETRFVDCPIRDLLQFAIPMCGSSTRSFSWPAADRLTALTWHR